MNQKIAGSSPARIDRVLCGKDLDRLVWQADQLQLRSCGAMDNASDYKSEDCRFECCQDQEVSCGKDLDRLVWQADRLQLMSEVLCCNGQCV